MSKILIFGFPHCGTSILKSIIGHIDDVDYCTTIVNHHPIHTWQSVVVGQKHYFSFLK